MKWGLLAFAVFAGFLNTIQAGSNASLNKSLQQPVWSAAVVFSVALAATLVTALVTGQKLPTAASVAQCPWWAWIGGILGAVYILSMVTSADKVGAAVFTGGYRHGRGDHLPSPWITFGLMGFEMHKANILRIIGGVLMACGLALIARF